MSTPTGLTSSQTEKLGSSKDQLESKIQSFITAIKRRQIEGSFHVAKETADIMRLVVSKSRFQNLDEVLLNIKEVGKRITAPRPLEFAIGNIVRRVLFIAREEYRNFNPGSTKPGTTIASSILSASTSALLFKPVDYQAPIDNTRELKASVLTAITELIEELQDIYRNISDQAIEHIHAKEVIMTFGGSRTVEEFLKAAGKKRKFEVIVCEAAPSYRGQKFALTLSNAGIETTLIPDSAVFAMMARVNKVIISTHAVMANGGLISLSGTHLVALAAKHHNVPVVVCTGLYKLSPLYPFDQDTFNDLKSPSSIMEFEGADTLEHVHVQNPAYDYVPPELVSLYVTNFGGGGHSPSYIYRLLAEYYNPEDTLD